MEEREQGSSRRGVVIGCGPLESRGRLRFVVGEAVPACTVDLKMMKPGCWMGGLRGSVRVRRN